MGNCVTPFIHTDRDAAYWRDKLQTHLDTNDSLAVINLQPNGGWATTGLSSQIIEWMKNNV
jgi:hypothetical protein